MDKTYLEAVNKRIQHHSEEIGKIKELGSKEPIWSESRKLFKKKQIAEMLTRNHYVMTISLWREKM